MNTPNGASRPRALGVDSDVLGAVVDEVAGDRDEIRRQRVRRAHDAVEKATRRVRPDVQVGELRDAEPVEARGRSGTSTSTSADDEPPRADVAEHEEHRP